ncbi:DUF2000 family protein [Aestuariispira insulae]|uniref:DUF2000 family protein n=1 Tax=Aestuariispira insulae TaxID=1461337 RepID=A0A3D9HF72_9PROT|nr:DUF2000 family protein [Aestuariispira insulae]RED48095.1 hypothetical protein DFP90_108113 [Aestuariispira insulae]
MSMFDTKIAIVLRNDLASWQKMNVVAFLTSGLVGQTPEILGRDYEDADGNTFNPLAVQPMIVLEGDGNTLSKIHNRALNRQVKTSAYVEEMFQTGHDDANRAVFKSFGPDNAKIVGLAMRAEKKTVDKITKGAKMHG